MLLVAKIVFFAFAALLIIGGIAGYSEKGSVMSIIAGTVCGLLSLAAGILLMPGRVPLACGLAIGAAVLVFGSQAPRVMKAPKLFPGITLIVTSVLTAGIAIATIATARTPMNATTTLDR